MTLKSIMLTFLLTGCSSHYLNSRLPASKALVDQVEMKLVLNRSEVLANGADSALLRVNLFIKGEPLVIDPMDLKILADREFEQTKFELIDGSYEVTIRPKNFSGDLRLIVAYKESFLSKEVNIKTFLTPRKEKLAVVPWKPSHFVYVSGYYQNRDGNALADQFSGFSVSNEGNNQIVNTKASKHSSRSFEFSTEQNASQNMYFQVTDAPNEITSHTMYSHFMLFPRTYIPQIKVINDNSSEVTLSTGEKLSFDYKGNFINGGVFEEGPVDLSGNRFKRKYADLKYKGKGILLRANARGQMPQQGQFEQTKIDLDHGQTGSSDVLIINGSTGERCRRPKLDFWSSADVNPILFKFPSDREFDAYLRSKCKFGIPEMELEGPFEKEDAQNLALGIWEACLSPSGGESSKKNYLLNLKQDFLRSDIKECLNEKIGLIEDKETKREVAYEAYALYQKDRKSELKDIGLVIKKHEESLVQSLYKDSSWIKDLSLKSLESECKLSAQATELQGMKFYDAKRDLNYVNICQKVKSQIEEHLEKSVSIISEKFIRNAENFSKILKISDFIPMCIKISSDGIDRGFDFFINKDLYLESTSLACEKVKSSNQYSTWLSSSEEGMTDELLVLSLPRLEKLAYQRADRCLVDFPMNNAINRIRFRAKRESCLRDSWDDLQRQSILDSFKVSGYEINDKIVSTLLDKNQDEGRRMLIKVMKEKF